MHWNSWSNCLKRSSQPCTSRFRASVSTPGKPSVYLSKNAHDPIDDNGSHVWKRGATQFQGIFHVSYSLSNGYFHQCSCEMPGSRVFQCMESTWKHYKFMATLVQNPIFRSNAVSTAGSFSLRHRTAWWRGTPRCSCESRAGSQPLNGTSMSQNGHPFGSKDNIGKTTENPWWYGNYIGKLYRCW